MKPLSEDRQLAPGVVAGTLEYLSPEQASDQELDRRTDIYSLGVVLFKVLSGQLPFDGFDPYQIMRSILTEAPPMHLLANVAPKPVRDLIEKTPAKDPARRPQTDAAVMTELCAILDQLP